VKIRTCHTANARYCSIKRVASAVGDGATVVRLAHEYLTSPHRPRCPSRYRGWPTGSELAWARTGAWMAGHARPLAAATGIVVSGWLIRRWRRRR
jgi:hypothetical protein